MPFQLKPFLILIFIVVLTYTCLLSLRLGGENLAVAQNTYSVNWFKGKELNMVFGLQLSFSRVVCVIDS